jgi:hypothetical protein
VGVRIVRRGTEDRLLLGGAVTDSGDSACVVVGDVDVVSARVDERDVVSDPVEEVSWPSRAIAVVPVGSNVSEVGTTSDRSCAVEPVNLTVDAASVVVPGSFSRLVAVFPLYRRRDSVDVEPPEGRSVAVVPVPAEPVPRSLAVRLDPTPSLVVRLDVLEPEIPDISNESGLTRGPA